MKSRWILEIKILWGGDSDGESEFYIDNFVYVKLLSSFGQ